MQLRHAVGAEARIQRLLRSLPGGLSLGALGRPASVRLTSRGALVGSGTDLHPALAHQRLQISGQRRCIEPHLACQVGWAQWTSLSTALSSEVLRRLPGGREHRVVSLAHAGSTAGA